MKRERPETPSQEEEIARLEAEIARIKTSFRDLENNAVVSNLRKEIAGLKSCLQVVQGQISDLESQASFEFQHVRANQMAIQKVADATGNSHIDTGEEVEMYGDERYQNYFTTRYQSLESDSAGGGQVPVSDPHLGS